MHDMARVIAALLLSAVMVAPAAAQFRAETLVRGLINPLAVVSDPTNPALFLIVEQRGLIRIARDGALLDQPFLDLRNEVRAGGEQGLLGLAFAPDATESRRLFVNFTNRDGDTVVARFRRSESGLTAEASSRFDLQWPDGRRVIPQPFNNHNGGHLAFGPDGYLYIGLGDGGSGGDPMNLAQNPQSLLGKMLRLDVNVPDDDRRGYRIPEDNPFLDGDPITALPEIWSIGWRNPWRYSFDDAARGGTNALVIADVGQNAREEINFEPPGRGGRNYGWRLREGRQPYDNRTPAAFGPLTDPIHDYSRSLGASVTGGVIYRGAALDPSFNGRYFFGDFVSGRVLSIGLHLHPLTSDASADDERDHTERLGRDLVGSVSSFGVDLNGEMLLVNYRGTVVRIVPDFAVVPLAPTAVSAAVVGSRAILSWSLPGGAETAGYNVERVRDGQVVSRTAVAGPDVTVDWIAGECVQIRAIGTAGWSGPPSSAICARLFTAREP